MPVVTSYRNGVPSWTDVGVPDIPRAVEFYTALFGWEAEDQGPDAGGYVMFSLDGVSVAGMGPQQNPEAPPLWATYVTVTDLDATVEKVHAAGGTIIVPAMDVMTAGRMAVAADAVGAVFSMWQAGDHIGSARVNEHGCLVWNELMARDADKAMAFYADVFGWGYEAFGDGEGAYQVVQLAGRGVAGIMPMIGDEWGDLPSHWMTYFMVDDIDATCEQITELGGTISVPPTEVPVGRFAVINDPTGGTFSIMQFPEGAVDDPNEGWTD